MFRFKRSDGLIAKVKRGDNPETLLWQIRMLLEGACIYLGTYRKPEKAQRKLEEIISKTMQGGTEAEAKALYRKVQSQTDGEPKQLPYEMMLSRMKLAGEREKPLPCLTERGDTSQRIKELF